VLDTILTLLIIIGVIGLAYESYVSNGGKTNKKKFDRAAFIATDWELEPQYDWAEIERAFDELLNQGKEPTYERAVTFLKREEEKIEQRKRELEIMRCPHEYVETFDIDQGRGGTKDICSGCGLLISEKRNPFARRLSGRDYYT
jgi:hypothetical protein